MAYYRGCVGKDDSVRGLDVPVAQFLGRIEMGVRIVVVVAFWACGELNAAEISKFREKSYRPNIAQREGLALLRIVGSPAALITEGYQFYEEYSAACGRSMPLSFLTGSVVGCFVMGFEIIGGAIELVSFQQVKSWAYPWEFDDPDQASIARMKEKHQKAASEDNDGFAEAAGAAVGAAAGAAVAQSMNKGRKGGGGMHAVSSSSGPGGSKKSSVKPRVKHSSCGGTGDCPICRGRGTVGNGIKCSGCGGSTRCRACRGTGYVN